MGKRHYEILFICHHIQVDKADKFSEKYLSLVKKKGEVTRYENWGVRKLAYTIDGYRRGLYILINIYCPPSVITEIEKALNFDDMVLRYMIMRTKNEIIAISPIMKIKQIENTEKTYQTEQNSQNSKESDALNKNAFNKDASQVTDGKDSNNSNKGDKVSQTDKPSQQEDVESDNATVNRETET